MTAPAVVVDLFAGAGGWDLGAALLGIEVIGVEWMDEACATRRAAGLQTIQGDVAVLDPFVAGSVAGLIASPPCQAFSTAGKRLGNDDLPVIYAVARNLAVGHDARVPFVEHPDLLADPRALLVVEPVRWAYAHRETLRWIALEQVPPVLPLWREFATYFRAWGFHVWTGVVNAADYSVPQTRKRAILLASRDRLVGRPAATHGDPPSHAAAVREAVGKHGRGAGLGLRRLRFAYRDRGGGGGRRTGAVRTLGASIVGACERAESGTR